MAKRTDKPEGRPELPPGAERRGNSIRVAFYMGYDAATKKRNYARRTVRTPEEAWEAYYALKREVEKGEYTPPTRQTVGEFLQEYLERSALPNVKPRTFKRYKEIIDRQIAPALGSIRLDRLEAKHVDGMLSDLKGKVSDQTRLHVYRVLHRALEIAVRWNLVGRNVCDRVEPPRVSEAPMHVLSAGDVERILRAAKGDRLYPLYLAALYTGSRQGELLALRWQDLDLEAGVAWVRQTLEKSGVKPVFGTPKNRKTRAVPLTEDLLEALRAHRVEQELERSFYAQEYEDHDLIFCQPNGRPLDPRRASSRYFKSLLKKAGLPSAIRFHDLRHTFVSRALAAGANLRAVSDIVGHHDPGFTAKKYAHALQEDMKEAARLLEGYLNRATSDEPDA